MEEMTLKVKNRDVTGKLMRAQMGANIPAVVYGADVDSQKLWVDALEIVKIFAQAGTNTVLSLVIDDAKPLNVLIYDFQMDVLSDEFTHIDFYAVNMKEEVEAEIPLTFVGVAAAVKELGGTLVKNNDTLVVRALPANLPREIEIDIAQLGTFDDSIAVSDITIGGNVHIILDDTAVIASVIAPRSEEEMAALDEEVDADVSKIEGVADKDGEDGEDEGNESADAKEGEEKTEKQENK